MNGEEVRRVALSFPDSHEAPHFDSASFRVNGKIFATMPLTGEVLHVFVDDTEREQAIAMHGDFIAPLFWGKKVRGVRVLIAAAPKEVVVDLLQKSWRKRATSAA